MTPSPKTPAPRPKPDPARALTQHAHDVACEAIAFLAMQIRERDGTTWMRGQAQRIVDKWDAAEAKRTEAE